MDINALTGLGLMRTPGAYALGPKRKSTIHIRNKDVKTG
jgi:hypothetical protein